MKRYNLINNVLGWAVFIVATTVYLITAEPTASWWDCGEYIATADKLQVGHPPGAPTFQLIGALFSNFAGSDVTKTAYTINAMSALCSGFTILFLFWSITMLAKKFVKKAEEMTTAQMIAIFGSGIVGSLAYTFSDTFWYSAVEGEVYAMSSCFTAIVFWAILKWESQADDAHNLRWLVLIAFLIGIAIGVHLLNLLTIPAITYVYYFKKFPNVQKGRKKKFVLVGLVSMILVAFILYFVVPYIVIFAGKFEIFFTNSIGAPFNTGTIIYFLLLIAAIVFGLYYTKKKNKPVWNASILSLLFILVGYTTFFVLVIRANANTPINENAPKDATSLLTYLNREQYGDTPLFHGQYYTATPIEQKDGTPKYIKDEKTKKYIEVRQGGKVVYDSKHTTIFPRMYSNDASRNHPVYYKMWSGIKEGSDRKPTFGENLTYFFRYQINHMYWRYFLWNFAGRQNDIQSFGLNYSGYEPMSESNGTKDLFHGNWITGIDFIDAWRLGPQTDMPSDLANNPGKNRLFCLPLLLGIAGLLFHIKKNPKDAFVVFLLFFMTGLAIVLYLNQPPCQPRERDYAYAGSFYAFAIWIGLGVYGIFEWLKKLKMPENAKAVVITVICFFAVPMLMANQEWDDHDRSGRYLTREFARNYLESCEPNAILITFGDNDTFPLWYAQEVEGIRTDVRVLNYTLSGMHWYVEQLYNKVYKSEKLPFTLDKSYYRLGLDVSLLVPSNEPARDVRSVLKELMTNPQTTIFQPNGDSLKVLQTNHFYIPFNKAEMAAKGIYPKELVDEEEGRVEFSIPVREGYQYEQLIRNELMFLDILGTNAFKRPIYVMNPRYLQKVFPNITEYIRQEGLVYRIVPYRAGGAFETARSFDLMNKKFQWGGVNDPEVYLEDAVSMNNSKNMRQNYVLLASQLTDKGQKDKALATLNKALKEFPDNKLPFDRFDISLAEAFFKAGDAAKGKEVLNTIIDHYTSHLNYYKRFTGKKARSVEGEKQLTVYLLSELSNMAQRYGLQDEVKKLSRIPEVAQVAKANDIRDLINTYSQQLNEASQKAQGGNKAEAEALFNEVLNGIEQNLIDIGNEQITEHASNMLQFIYSIAQRTGMTNISGKIESNPRFAALVSQASQPMQAMNE